MQISVIVITGASSGLGEALAHRLAGPGTTLHLIARRRDRLEALSGRLAARGALVRLHVADVGNREAMNEVASRILSGGSPPDLVIANAGIRGPGEGNAPEALESLLTTNVLGVSYTVDPFLPAMRQARKGHLVIVGSLAGYRGLPSAGSYCASKAALSALSDSLRFSLEPEGLTVSLVNPGYVETEMTRQNPYPMPFVISADEASRRIVRGISRKSARIEFPLPMVLLVRLLALLPPRSGDFLLRLASSSHPEKNA